MLPAEEVNKYRFTVEEFHKMGEAGIFGEDDRVELVEGEIVKMAPIGWRHMESTNRLNMLLAPFAAREGLVVSVQNPLVLGEYGEHYPDIVLYRAQLRGRVPEARDALVVIEVSDTTLAYDRNVKLPRYAAASIPEVWIVDVGSGAIELHAHPEAGRYLSSHRFGPGELVVSETVEGLRIGVDEVLP